MFWMLITVVIVAVAFAKLGALSVWVSILFSALKLIFALLIGLAGYLVWRRWKTSRQMVRLENHRP